MKQIHERIRELNSQIVAILGEQSRLDHLQEECAELAWCIETDDVDEAADVYVLLHAVFPELCEPRANTAFGDESLMGDMCMDVIIKISKLRRGLITRERLCWAARELLNAIVLEFDTCELQDAVTRKLDRTEAALSEGTIR